MTVLAARAAAASESPNASSRRIAERRGPMNELASGSRSCERERRVSFLSVGERRRARSVVRAASA